MARFYTSTVNSRGNEVTAMGNARGQDAHLRGWSAGVEVRGHPDVRGDKDEFDVYMTDGSSGYNKIRVGTVTSTPDGPVFTPTGSTTL